MRDLSGQRFGRLVALEPTDERRRNGVVWRCVCDCGRELDVCSDYLVRGRVADCGNHGSRNPGRALDLVGRHFGHLEVVRRAGSRGSRATWWCLCECGRKVEATTYELTSGRKTSCGCVGGNRRPAAPGSIACGMRFGRLVAVDKLPSGSSGRVIAEPAPSVEPAPSSGQPVAGNSAPSQVGDSDTADASSMWRCVCDCNRIVSVPAAELLCGAITSCGQCS